MSQLSDSQVMVLAYAAQRDDGVVILPESLRGAAAVKVVKALLDRRLVQEIRAKKGTPAWRRGADYGLKITRAGRQAIGLDQGGGDDPDLRQLHADASSVVPKPVRAGSKKAIILALLAVLPASWFAASPPGLSHPGRGIRRPRPRCGAPTESPRSRRYRWSNGTAIRQPQTGHRAWDTIGP